MARKADQTDLEDTPVDRAIRTVKAFQAGRTNVAAVKTALGELSPAGLSLVKTGTRVPVSQLREFLEA